MTARVDWSAAAFVATVRGLPAPQGSKNRNASNALYESSKKVKPWRQDVKYAALEVVGDAWTLLDGPLGVRMIFTFARPRSHYRTGRNAHLLRDGAPLRPAVMPDLSKIVRSTEDALTDAGVWADDSRVVELFTEKRYANEGPDALEVPGVVIRVRRIEATQ